MGFMLTCAIPMASQTKDVEAQQAAAERRKTQQAQIGKTLLNFSARGERDKVHPAMEMPYPMRAIYDIAPRIRPLVFVGPSKLVRGCCCRALLRAAVLCFCARVEACRVCFRLPS